MNRPSLVARLAISILLAALLAVCGGDGGEGGGGGTTEPEVVTTIDVTPSTATLAAIGENRQLQAAARSQSGGQMSGVSFTWSSSDESVATVTGDGLVTAEDNGSATIRARADGVTGDASVTVDQSPSLVEVTPGSTTLTAIGATEQFTAEVYDALGNPVTDESATVTWSSSNESVATVDASGLATAQANGDALIAAATEGVTADGALTVGQEPASVALTPESTTLTDLGVTQELSATALDSEGNTIDGVSFTWSSSDTTTATVDDDGLVTSVREGTVEIEARVGDVGATASLTVDLPPGRVIWVPAGDGLWSDVLNWSCKCMPAGEDDVFFTDDGTYTVTVDADALVNSIEVGGTSGAKTLRVPAGKVLDISAGSSISETGAIEIYGGKLGGTGQLTNGGALRLKEGLITTLLRNEGTLEVGGAAGDGSPPVPSGSWAASRGAEPGESVIEGEITTTSTSVIRIVADEDITGGGSPASLTVADGFSNAGLIEMITGASSSEGRIEIGGSGELENLGELVTRSDAGGTGTNKLLAKLNNKGAVNVHDQRFLVSKASAVHRNEGEVAVSGGELLVEQSGTDPAFTNLGTLGVAAGATLTTDGGVLTHAEGSILQGPGLVRLRQAALDLDVDLIVAEGEVELDGSEVAGAGQLRNEATLVLRDGSRIVPSLQNAGTLRVLSTSPDPATVLESRIDGPLATEAGSVIQVGDENDVDAEGVSPTVLVVADGFANNGLVELITESNSSEARLRIEGTGFLENAGEIVNRAAGGGEAQNLLDAALKNAGDVRVAAGKLRLDKFGAEHTNEADGRILVEQGEMRLKLTGDSPVFTNRSAATLDILAGASLVTDEGNLVNESGGVIQGDGTLGVEQAGVSLVDALTLTGTIRMSDGTLVGSSLTLEGTLELEGFSTVDVAVEVASGGTLALHAPVADPTLQTSVEMFAALTIDPGATVELLADGSGGTVLTLEEDFTNEGTLALLNGAAGSEARLEVLGGTSSLANNGEIVSRADGGSGTNVIDANLTNFGTVTVHAASRFVLGASAINEGSGVMEGEGTIEPVAGLLSVGTIRPGIGGPGVLTVDGDLDLEVRLCFIETCDPDTNATSQLDMEVGGAVSGSEYDQLVVTGEADLGGRLEIIQVDGFVPQEGDQFEVINFVSKANDFTSVGPTQVDGEPDLEWSSFSTATQFFLDVIRP